MKHEHLTRPADTLVDCSNVIALVPNRVVLQRDWMVGTETSSNDWGGWAQFMPMVAHWGTDDDVATLWWHAPRVARATILDEHILLETDATELTLRMCAAIPKLHNGSVRIGPWVAVVASNLNVVATAIDRGITELKLSLNSATPAANTTTVSVTLKYDPVRN